MTGIYGPNHRELQDKFDSFAGEFEKLVTMEQEALNRLLEPELI